MKCAFVWFLLVGAALLPDDGALAWNRQFFNRYSRNFLRNGDPSAGTAAANEEISELNALFGIGGAGAAGGGEDGGHGGRGGAGDGGQQAEVYGIVEPLIEDLPCVDRPCAVNDDCCPTGVCVNTYGEGKCIYVYGRKRDLCHRHGDCEAGQACLRGPAGGMTCQAAPAHLLTWGSGRTLDVKQFGDDCNSSSDCNVAKGMCCQLQRSHHRLLPKKLCAYFRDPFMCIDIMPNAEEEDRRVSSFSQRRM